MENEIIRSFTDQQVEEHAGKVGGKRNLREVVINTDDGLEIHYLVKKPSRMVMQAIASLEKKNDPDAIQKAMLGCVLEGDREIYEHDGSIYLQLLEQISKLLETSKGDIKKL